MNESTQQCFTVVNTAPTVASATINDTDASDGDDLLCNNGSINDVDGDIITLFYDWLNNSISRGINNQKLGAGNTSVNDNWICRIWGGDTFNNGTNTTSASVSIGTGFVAPIINFTNATTETIGIQSDSINPTNNNSWINLSVNFTDSNAGDRWTSFYCTTDSFSGSNCSGTTLCSSVVNQSTNISSCMYNTTDVARGAYTYYVFVLDNASLVSASQSGTYEINTHPTIPTLTSPSNNTFINVNYTWLNYSSSDLDSDTITYLIYANNSGSFILVFNGTTTSFNYTNLTENRRIHWFVSARDEHNHTSENSSQFFFTTDYTIPTVTINNPINGTTYQARNLNVTVTHGFTASDVNLGICIINVTLSSGSSVISNREVNCTNPPTDLSIDVFANNLRYNLFVNDSAGNTNRQTRIFSTAQEGLSGGGGGGTVKKECEKDEDCIIYGDEISKGAYYCLLNKCILNESLLFAPACGDGVCSYNFEDKVFEDLLNCPDDCPANLTAIIACVNSVIDDDDLCVLRQNFIFVLLTLILLIGLIWLAVVAKKRKEKRRRK